MKPDIERDLAGEIGITPAMIEAGVCKLVGYYPEDNDDQDAEDRRAVTAIYKAMLAARPVDVSR
jgi:hypothetical protein